MRLATQLDNRLCAQADAADPSTMPLEVACPDVLLSKRRDPRNGRSVRCHLLTCGATMRGMVLTS